MKTALVLSGGGTWGVMPAYCLEQIETYLKKPIYQLFDIIAGSSTGAILGSQLAAGVPALTAKNLYVNKGKQLFKPRSKLNPFNWAKEKYDRQPIIDEMATSFLNNSDLKKKSPLMSELKTKFMCTSVSIIDERTHYFKNWEERDGKLNVLDAVARSFAAAYYFGAINDPVNQQVWVDGGEGSDNLPLIDVYLEAKTQDWLKEGLTIISFGCGDSFTGTPYKVASKMGWLSESRFFLNLARRQSVREQLYEVDILSKDQNVTLNHMDFPIPKAWDRLDNADRIPDAVKIAQATFDTPAGAYILKRIKDAKGL